jgi:flavin reductase (DIM6/NTAB) family NADH-FMN oxidoreductase RutF
MTLDPAAFRQSMRHWTTGIAIFTAQHEEQYHGMTVSSFTSVSLEPPLVVASIQKDTRTHNLADRSGAFAITILSEDQVDISNHFAGRMGEEQDRFLGLEIETLLTGAPLITGGLAFFDCKIVDRVNLGSHTIFIGEVLATRDINKSKPLAYYDRAYRKLQV